MAHDLDDVADFTVIVSDRMGFDFNVFLTTRRVMQMQYPLLAARCQAVGQRTAFARSVTGHCIVVGNFIAAPVMERVAIAIGIPVGLVGGQNPVIRCECDRRCIDHVEYPRDFGLCALAEMNRFAHAISIGMPLMALYSIRVMPKMALKVVVAAYCRAL